LLPQEETRKQQEREDRFMQSYWGTPLRLIGMLALGILLFGETFPSHAQTQQEVIVTIEDYTFRTSQMPLQLHADTIIRVKNLDNVRHDFGSQMFFNTLTHVESHGVETYGKGVEGVFLDPGQEAIFRLVLDKVGRFQFQCSIHPDMKGEILLLIVNAV
jgi:plastocyanin